MGTLSLFLLLSVAGLSAQSFEAQALQISKDIQTRHLPFGTILSPVFAAPESDQIISYTRCGDSAIWTGHYLAAESFRYAVTKSPDALEAARLGLRGLKLLVDVTGSDNLLARCVLRGDSPYAADPRNEERQHGESKGSAAGAEYYWIGNTSRDQYLGVFFGLSVAYDHLPQEDRTVIRDIGSRLLNALLSARWSVFNTTFLLRPDQQLAILQVGRQINPESFRGPYEDLRRRAIALALPISLEALEDHESYFKFNLDALALYSLLRLEEESSRRGEYIATYRTFRSIVAGHGNVFFNVIDRALVGANPQRDAETARLMVQWLDRPRRDFYVDLRGKYQACGSDRSCDPIPVIERVRTDFLWQRSPFLLYGGGSGRVETPGIDFILPYWMARYYGQDFAPQAASAASGLASISPESIVSLFGAGMPPNGAQVKVTDSVGTTRPATVLFSSSEQVNFVVPRGSAIGEARIAVHDAAGMLVSTSNGQIQRVAPGLFTANATGRGVAAASAIRVEINRLHTNLPVFRCNGPALCIAELVEVSEDRPVYVSLFGTGIRSGSSVAVSIGGVAVPVLYAGPQVEFDGLDQINVRLPGTLRGKGEVDVVLTVDGVSSTAVRIGIR
jgi:uncharacterized protein (TIGR03437 family)